MPWWTVLSCHITLCTLMEMPCVLYGTGVRNVFDEVWGFSTNLYCWVGIWTAFNFIENQKLLLRALLLHYFYQHDMWLAFFRTSVHQCVPPIQIAHFLKQSRRCVMLSHNKWWFLLSWLWKRRAMNRCCPAFVSWPGFPLCSYLPSMLSSIEWCHSFETMVDW